MNGPELSPALMLSGLSMLMFCVVSWVLAIRLLRLARRTHETPEIALALSYLFIAGIGYPMCAASVGAIESLGPDHARFLLSLGTVIIRAGLAAMLVFAWQSLRPTSSWAKWACLLGSLAVTVNAVQSIIAFHSASSFEVVARTVGSDSATIQIIVISMLIYAWPAVESLRYYRLLKRRRSLGLAEPIVVNRFLLWGVACSSSVVVNIMNLVVALRGLNIMDNPTALVGSSLMGVLASVLLIFAFLPPAWYMSFVAGDAGEGAAS